MGTIKEIMPPTRKTIGSKSAPESVLPIESSVWVARGIMFPIESGVWVAREERSIGVAVWGMGEVYGPDGGWPIMVGALVSAMDEHEAKIGAKKVK